MKHRLLLDSNIIYLAVKGVDAHGNPDATSTELVRLIGQNCHTVVADRNLVDRYQHHVRQLYAKPPLLTQATNFVIRILENSAKFCLERAEPPELPGDARVPREDVHVVRAALTSRPTIVTADGDLLKAIRRHFDLLAVR